MSDNLGYVTGDLLTKQETLLGLSSKMLKFSEHIDQPTNHFSETGSLDSECETATPVDLALDVHSAPCLDCSGMRKIV